MSEVEPRCPRCTSSQVDHVWRTDMAELTLIDRWTCRDTGCGHHWATRVTYAQLQEAGPSAARDPSPGAGPAL